MMHNTKTTDQLNALVRLCNESIVEPDRAACNAKAIRAGLLELIAATPEAEEKHVFKIGGQPAVYKRGDGHFTAVAHAGPATYIMDVKPFRDRVVGQFLVDGEMKLNMMGNSFRRVIGCLASASNAYIHMNQRARERKRRAAKKEEK